MKKPPAKRCYSPSPCPQNVYWRLDQLCRLSYEYVCMYICSSVYVPISILWHVGIVPAVYGWLTEQCPGLQSDAARVDALTEQCPGLQSDAARVYVLTEQCPGLQSDAARVDVLDQLSEHVRLKLLDDERLVLTLRRLPVRSGHGGVRSVRRAPQSGQVTTAPSGRCCHSRLQSL